MTRALIAAIGGAIVAVTIALPASSPAATSYPKSSGFAGCTLTNGTLDTTTETGAGIAPAVVSTDPGPGGSAPAVMVVNCTTLTVPAGTTVQVTGTRALDLRATGAIDVEGTLDASGATGASGGTPGPGAGAGATSAPTPGGGPGGGLNGAPAPSGVAAGAAGTQGPAYGSGGGAAGTVGGTPTGAGSGGGGGGAGSGGVGSVATDDFVNGRGSGGGRGGDAFNGVSAGGSGGGGGGALRLISDDSITVGSSGVIGARGGSGGSSPIPSSGSASGGAGGGGSGGFIGLIAPTVTIKHVVDAGGGNGGAATGSQPAHAAGGGGANGSIRVLTNTYDTTGAVVYPLPPTPATHSHLLTVATSGTGTGAVTSGDGGIDCGSDCSDPYDPGAMVTLTAAPGPSSTFAGWSGTCSGMALQCVVTMDAAKSATANFDATAGTPPPGGGTPTPPSGGGGAPTAPRAKKCRKHKGRAAIAKKCKHKGG